MKQATSRQFTALFALPLAALLASLATAQQSQQPAPLRFEVAAIKPSVPGQIASKVLPSPLPGGTFRLVNMPLKRWVEMALSVNDYALKAPPWLGESNYDLDAKVPTDGPADQKATNEMLLTLLTERFGLTWHHERGSVSGYKLVIGKKLLLKASDTSDPKQRGGSSRGPALIAGHNMPMSDLAMALGEVLERPVIDSTHLSGGFEIRLMWRPDGEAALALANQMKVDVDNLPSIFTALQEQLGLRLQRAQVPSDVIVVDSISRQPTDN